MILRQFLLVPADELDELEHLCRYVTRPPIAPQRLALAPTARVVYGLKCHWRDGTSAVSLDPLTFIERLAALVPDPRTHQLTYHGVLALASAWRDLVVPKSAPVPAAYSRAASTPKSPTAPRSSARSRSSRSSLGRTPAPRLRCRRPHLPPLRRRTPPHRAAHRPSRRAQDALPPRTAHRASTARTGTLARTVRLRLSRRPSPRRARHALPLPAPLPQPARASRSARLQRARTTAPAGLARLAGPTHCCPRQAREAA